MINHSRKFLELLFANRVCVVQRREPARLDVLPVIREGLVGLCPDVAVLLDELGNGAVGGKLAQEVALDEDLAGASVARADADGRYDEPARDDLGHPARHGLDDDGKAPGVLHRRRVLEELAGGVGRLPLNPEAAESVHPLRRQPYMRHHGDAGLHDLADGRRHARAALELHGMGAALLDEPDGSLEALFGRDLV